MTQKIPSFISDINNEMIDAAVHALENEKFVLGESVFKFEEEFAKYIGTKNAISVNSGSSALYLSLLAANISNNSKVITSTNSFIASSNTIISTGAEPILVDIDESDGNIDIKNNQANADAIIPIHIYGNPCDFESVKEFAETKKIPIIEDACQAHGATYKGKKVGSLGQLGCFSFYPTKNMTVGGDGGMITTDDDDLAKTLISLRDNGRKESNRAVHEKFGFTMRLNTVNAAIGRVELKNLDEKNKRRTKIAGIYEKNLSKNILLSTNKLGQSVFHQIVIKHKERDKIKNHLLENGIGTAIHYAVPIHKQPIYSNLNLSLPVSETFANQVLSLPSYPQLTDDEILVICEKINEII
jgi:perosamine synthetase